MLSEGLQKGMAHVPIGIESFGGSLPPAMQEGAEMCYSSGRGRMLKRQYVEAIADFNLAVKADPSDIRAYLDRARALSELGNHSAVISTCEEITRKFPSSIAAYLMRAGAYARMGMYENAIDDYSLLVALTRSLKAGAPHPAVPAVYEGRSRVYDSMGLQDLAQADRARAAQFGAW